MTETVALNDILDGKADVGHTHAISDITNLQSALDGKAASNHNHDSTYAPISHTHPSSQITDLSALKIEIFKMIYPIGSIYQSFEPIETVSGGSTYYPQITWNDCVWQLLDSGQFLRSVSLQSAQLPGGGYGWTIGQSGVTDGSATHTHTTADHILTIDEMPSHCHNSAIYLNHANFPHIPYSTEYDNLAIESYGNSSRYGMADTSFNGGGQAHNHGNTGSASNLPPCITVYMYKRIA